MKKTKCIISTSTAALVSGVLLPILLAAPVDLQPSDLKLEHLSGQVKRIDEKVSNIKVKNGTTTEGSKRRSRTVVFDKLGRITYKWIQLEGLDPQEEYYSYPKAGRRLRRTIRQQPFDRSLQPPRPQFSVSEFRWAAAENTLYEVVYISGRSSDPVEEFSVPTQRYKTVFDSGERPVKRSMLTESGLVASTDEYRYGVDDLPSERILFVSDNPQPQKISYQYVLDSTGNWIKRIETKIDARPGAGPETTITYREIEYYKD